MAYKKFIEYLSNLGYSKEYISQNLNNDTFLYHIVSEQYYKHSIYIKYIYIPKTDFNKIFIEKHTDIWNENIDNIFIVVSEHNTYLINAKVKPNRDTPLHKNNIIENFSYGINSQSFQSEELNKLKETISKDGIDSAYFFDFVVEKTKQQKTSEVDKDLLLNLIQLRNDLLEIRDDCETIHLLILRCLFIKYLEDRGIYEKDYLVNILKTKSPQKLIDAFEEIKRINGDIFKYDEFSIGDIYEPYLEKLEIFFSCFDYRTGQGLFFPYKFDKIPIQLISHVYEAFLSNARKGNKGIFYTPQFIVQFMLSHTVQTKLKNKKDITVFDPACGSGAFLVEAFKEIVKANKAEHNYNKKIEILEEQIFGIDIDKQALQIATFSLYLALLEREKSTDIQEKIENAYPILPSLINRTLIKGNSLVDDIFTDKTFDCIVANPPWGTVEKDGDDENKRERKAIGAKGITGTLILANNEKIKFPAYKNVSDYQRSQAFLLRINKWCHSETVCSLIVNNSIFLNEWAEEFRKELLNQYRITYFYELSHLNKILFKKKNIGKIRFNNKDVPVEVGATEPCAVIVFDKKDIHSNIIQYISPKLTKFSESFELIHYTQKDIKTIKQEDLQKEDYWLWRIFVNGFWVDYQLMKQKYFDRDVLEIECTSGFQPEKNMKSLGEPLYRDLIEPKPQYFERYLLKNKFDKFNWNQELRTNPEIKKIDVFKEKRLLIPLKFSKLDKLRIRGIRVEKDIIHKHDILCIKIKRDKELINNYAPYLAILNSSFLGYYIYHISAQSGKGEEKRSALRNSDIEKLPFPEIPDKKMQDLTTLVEQIETYKKEGKNILNLENQIEEIVFDLYDLLDYEKEIIREFYQVNVDREGDTVKLLDMKKYIDKFRQVFSFILAEHLVLNATYRISSNLGAYVNFTIVKKEEMIPEAKLDTTEDKQLLNIVKKKQLSETFFSHRLNEDKVKIYEDNNFFIIKSNYFKDWTIRQAMNDANEEIRLILKELPEND